MKVIILLLLQMGLSTIQGYHFLLIVVVGNKSLHNLFMCLAEALTSAGHSVTTVSKFSVTPSNDKLKHIQLRGLSEKLQRTNLFVKQNSFEIFPMFVDFVDEASHNLWTNDEITQLWKNRNLIDAIVTPSYLNEVAFPFLINFTGVFATFCTPGIEYFSIGSQGNWLSPAVVPNMFIGYDENMVFFERAMNFATILFTRLILDFYVHPKFQASIEKYFPEIGDVFRYYDNASVTLINTHFALESSVPLLPNQVEVGTIATRDPKPLTKDLEEFMNGSGEAGVIYFSIGSLAKSTDIPERHKQMILEVFHKIPQRVLWKYEGDDLILPSNVIARKWFPQQDILGHPKTRLFISHCGNLGTQEAKYHGVPILAVPITFDQPRNAARLVRKGYGLVLNWPEMTVETIMEALHELINNTEYKERMKDLKRLLHDQKESPQDRAVWWLEYVIRHKGAPHLRYPGKGLHFLQYIMVDVIVMWGVFTAFTFILLKCLFIKLCNSVIYILCKFFWKEKAE